MADHTAVLFDLDDTLCEYGRSRDEMLRIMFDRAGADRLFSADDFERWIDNVHGKSPLDLREKCFLGLADERGFDEDLAYELAAKYPERDPANVQFLPGAREALDHLADRYDLGLVTNGAESKQREKLSSLGVLDRFDSAVYATPESSIKPDPDPIYEALDQLEARPEEAVMIGDSVEADVMGAKAAGVTSVLYGTESPSDRERRPDYRIESLRELTSRPYPWE